MPEPTYAPLPCEFIENHDGDTFFVRVEAKPLLAQMSVRTKAMLWPLLKEVSHLTPNIRLAHCNAVEIDKPGGVEARDAVTRWLTTRSALLLDWKGRDKYERLVADVLKGSRRESLSEFVLALPGTVPMELHRQLV